METRQEEMQDTLRKEANTVIQQDDVDKWIGEGLPTAFTRGVLNKIMEKLIEKGYAGAGARAGDENAWNGADLHAKQALRDDSVAQAGKVTWLNGSLIKIDCIIKINEKTTA
ncbi:hypothetical protein SCLCIDRAFT_31629 [Scleroderma citrinum Foug A]|uniref:Uncharacterized protein n=1 Tax=Scleroderma citrinum Foug A TaxID=1036808 RepID=A0A0C3CYX9_9AGAM|nr:hypothetical protein SCLCIDRAFT_31629 [Scleroderma citrinum Foug A]